MDGKAYAIGFEMRLPLAWNGRFLYQANGGLDGAVAPAVGAFGGGPVTGRVAPGVRRHQFGAPAGHSGPADFSFGIDPQARLDYGYQAVGKLTPMAKAVIRAAVWQGPGWFVYRRLQQRRAPCHGGGGPLSGAVRRVPRRRARLQPAEVLALQHLEGAEVPDRCDESGRPVDGIHSPPSAARITNAVLTRCDALDGAVDGLVQDTQACQAAFDLQRDVPTCTGARDGTCLKRQRRSPSSVRSSMALRSATARRS